MNKDRIKKDNACLKIGRITRLMIILILTGVAYASASSYALEHRVSVEVTDGTFYDVVTQIEKQSEFMFFYKSEEINNSQRVTLVAKNKLVSEVLNELLEYRDMTYRIMDKHIIIVKTPPVTQQQGKRITGTVTDEKGEPIIGANVVEKGTTNGLVTDADGKFALTVSENATLQVSFIGYITQEINVLSRGGGSPLVIMLIEDAQALEEVVVVAYGTQKKVNLTGSVASVKFSDIATMPVANTANMLQGRLAGVVLTNNGAQAGRDNPEIRIRGVGTFSNDDDAKRNDPMVVIDGIESDVSQIAQIPADDIESVSVLKDAASASIYGVRAANGVILITTKRGLEQKTQVTYSGSIAIQKANMLANYLNSADWATLFNEAKGAKVYTDEMIQKLRDGSDPDHFANTQWLNEMFRAAPMHQHHLSVNGGASQTHYMFSAQYFDQTGILLNSASKRYNFRSNVDSQLGILKIGLNVSGSKQSIDEPTTSITGEGLMRYITWFTRPTVPVQYSNGQYGYVDGTSLSHTIFKNPIDAIYRGNKDNGNYRFDGKLFGEVEILKNLQLRSSIAYKFYREDISTYSPRTTVYDADGQILNHSVTNSLEDRYTNSSTFLNENLLSYSFRSREHDLSFLAGHSIQVYRTDWGSSSIQNFATDNLYEINAGTLNPAVSGQATENTLQSYFGRLNYMFDSKYLFEFDIRHDGSSRMPRENRYATFPSFSAGWIISNETFMENIKGLSSLKIRGSWGTLGNQEIGDYAYLQSLVVGANYYFGNQLGTGLKRPSIANDKIKWETTSILDIGFDASFWNNRISVTFDWFDKKTDDILLRLAMAPSFLGTLSAPYQNAGKVENKGWEWAMNYIDSKKDLTWQAGFNLSSVHNTILDNKGVDTYGNNTINREGYAINSYYGLKAVGLYRTEEDLTRSTVVNGETKVITQFGVQPSLGDIMYADLDNNGNINDDDRDIIGNPFPKLQYGINAGLSWKNLDFSVFWQGIGGIYRYNWEQTTLSNGGNMTTRWLDRYGSENGNGSMPRIGNTYNDRYSSFWLTKADYLRLKNLEIGYTFTQPGLAKAGITSLRIYVAGTNLLTFTSLENFDPEKSSTDMRNDVHPNTQTYSFGLNVKF
jgi:TonB-linked SusC/RagA family outer membrane protein